MSKSIKLGYVRLRPRGAGAWQADWRDPQTGLRQRRTIRAASQEDARRQAKALSDSIAAGRYDLRCRTIDANGIAQPLPRPFLKSGHNAIECVALTVQV